MSIIEQLYNGEYYPSEHTLPSSEKYIKAKEEMYTAYDKLNGQLTKPQRKRSIIPTPKNKDFDNQYNLRHDEKIDILKSLTAYDCISIEPNDNPRYPDSEVYKFTKQITVLFYGSPESPNIYLKMYIQECPSYDQVLVISFHKEGMHD